MTGSSILIIDESKEQSEHGEDNGGKAQRNPWNPAFVFVMAVVYLILPATTFSMGCVNTPAQHIKDFLNDTHLEREGEAMATSRIESLFGLLVAVSGLGASVGCLLASYLMNAVGRKYGIVVTAMTTMTGSLIMGFSKMAASYEMIFVGRVITGMSAGFSTTIAPAYVMESCLPEAKPTAALVCQVLQSVAIMFSNIVGFDELLGTPTLWPYLLGLPATVCALQLLLIPFCPESPRFLLMKKKSLDEAKRGLRFIRGKKDVDEDIKELYKELEESKLESLVSIPGLLTTPSLRRPMIVAITMGFYINWCGVDSILLFSTQLFRDVGMADKIAKYATSGTGLIIVVGNLTSSFIMSKFKRKTLYRFGNIGIGLCCVIVAFTMMYKEEVEDLKYVNVVASLMLIAFYAIGPACLFWVIIAELFPHSARGAGFGIAVQSSSISFFSHSYIFPEMLIGIQEKSFFVFAGLNVLMIIFVHFVIPETKNRSYPEMKKEHNGV